MGDTKTTLTWVLKDEVSKTAQGLGASLKGMLSPAALATAGVGALAVGVGLVIEKAKAHEVVSKRLDAVLQANVKGWDGNRQAIDKYIQKQTDNGFTVDETTASLAQLTAATHDTQKAQEFQAAAMDLARLKGISLADATDAMTKVEGAHNRVLQTLGITLAKGATATDALAAVQKVAAGQTDAYNHTLEGSFSKVSAKIDDSMTKIGDAILPVFEAVVSFIADHLDGAIAAIGVAFQVLSAVVGPIVATIMAVLGPLVDLIKAVVGWFDTLFAKTAEQKKQSAEQRAMLGGGRGSAVVGQGGTGVVNTGGRGHRASGGPVDAGGAYLVGEHGPELLVMGGRSGNIVPNGGGMGSPVILQFMLNDRVLAQAVDRQLYYMAKSSPATRLRN